MRRGKKASESSKETHICRWNLTGETGGKGFQLQGTVGRQRRYEISCLCLFCAENKDLSTPRTVFTEK